MTLRLSTRYALLLITFGTLFHIHAQPLPAVSDCNTAAVADSSTMPRPADYPSAPSSNIRNSDSASTTLLPTAC